MSNSTLYTVTNAYKKSSYENEHYSKIILGKRVTLIITTVYRWGEFEVNLTEEEKKKILNEDIVCLNDYDSSFVSNIDGCEQFEEIEDLKDYTDDEKRAIYKDIYEDVENKILFNKSELEDNDWDLNDTIYELVGGIDLTE
tara:strand:+ start:1132 stop:1554 length:423 start_codon:yes stop_codon:yes gene_type:complete